MWQLALLGLSGASNELLPGGKRPNGAHCSYRIAEKLAAVLWSELVEPGRSAAEVTDYHWEVHECRCPGTLLELLPAGVAVGLASELLVWFSGLSGGVFLPWFGGRVCLLVQSLACWPVGGFSSPRYPGHWWQLV